MNMGQLNLLISLIRSKRFIIIFGSLLVLFCPIAVVTSSFEENKHEGYLAMTTLGSNMEAKDYFANRNGTLGIGEQVSWHLSIHNGMPNAEFVSLRIKLLNSTEAPDSRDHNQTNSEATVFELDHLVSGNGTWTVPVNWSIGSIDNKNGSLVIESLNIDGHELSNLDVKNANSQNFRLVMELWRYNSGIGDFESSWTSSLGEKRSVWNEIWFNVRK
jgi:hypothetical protein